MSMGRDMRMLRIRKGARRIIHRAHDAAGKWQGSIMASSLFCQHRFIIIPFRSIHTLGREQVGISALPAAGNSSTMKVNRKMMACRTLQEVDAILHRFLFIASKEVNLHSSYAHFLQPGKLLLPVFRSIQSIVRTWCTPSLNPCSRRIIPKQRLHTPILSIFQSLLDGGSILHLIPFCINQYVWQMQGLRHIYILFNDIQVV